MRKRRRTPEEQNRVDQQNWYDEMHTTQVKLKLNNRTDRDVLDWMRAQRRWDSHTTVQGEIKRLIRQEIALRTGGQDIAGVHRQESDVAG